MESNKFLKWKEKKSIIQKHHNLEVTKTRGNKNVAWEHEMKAATHMILTELFHLWSCLSIFRSEANLHVNINDAEWQTVSQNSKTKQNRQQLELKCDSVRKKVYGKATSAFLLTPKTKATKMMKAVGIKPVGPPETQKQLLFTEAISLEIQLAGSEKKRIKKKVYGLSYLEKYWKSIDFSVTPLEKLAQTGKTIQSQWKSHKSCQTKKKIWARSSYKSFRLLP